jgi:hypothetical protein
MKLIPFLATDLAIRTDYQLHREETAVCNKVLFSRQLVFALQQNILRLLGLIALCNFQPHKTLQFLQQQLLRA